jgi:hypothetical protein
MSHWFEEDEQELHRQDLLADAKADEALERRLDVDGYIERLEDLPCREHVVVPQCTTIP